MYSKRVPFDSLVGFIFTEIIRSPDDSKLTFVANTGAKFHMEHFQDCCEDVSLDDVVGDLGDLLNSPVTQATEDTSHMENPEGVRVPEYQDSFTWTFYTIATAKGTVTLRWYGESNGYYSESVDVWMEE